MNRLNDQQRQLLFDYCFGFVSDAEKAQIEEMVFSNEEAAQIHSKLTNLLSQFESLELQECPDNLVERTVLRLNNTARASQLQLEQLIADEQKYAQPVKGLFMRNFGQFVAAAAVIILFASAALPTLGLMRQKAWNQKCQSQLANIGNGVINYRNDNNDQLPSVAMSAGAPWWKVGYNPESNENNSNTRHLWLLVKHGYVDAEDFVCPGRREGGPLQFDPSKEKDIKELNDFLDKRYVTYSFRVRCNKSKSPDAMARRILVSDANPLFEKLPVDNSGSLKLEVNDSLMKFNSINHNQRGQNILFCDGGVKFIKKRTLDISDDDIFTLQDTTLYRGVEIPSCETDVFLAP